jgi:hypothetical protein
VLEVIAVIVGMCAVIIYAFQLKAFINATRVATQTQILMNMPLIVPELSEINWSNTATKEQPSIWVVQNFRNIGETRAIGANIVWGWGHQLPDTNAVFQDTYNSEASWIWMPNHPEQRRKIVPIDDARELAAFKKPLYVHGQIRYMDLFPPDGTLDLETITSSNSALK